VCVHVFPTPHQTLCFCYSVLLAHTFGAGVPDLGLGTKLTGKNATNAKTLANLASRRTESNGRCPGPRFCQNPEKNLNCIWPTRARPGLSKVHLHTYSYLQVQLLRVHGSKSPQIGRVCVIPKTLTSVSVAYSVCLGLRSPLGLLAPPWNLEFW